MKKTFLLSLLLTLLGTISAWAQAPVATAEEAVTALLNRIGGNGAADKFEIVIDANLAENGQDVFVITSQNGKPCIKGNTQLSVATGINWYLNHHAHINLTWNNLTTDLSQVTLPVPGGEEKHVCNTTYRYDFNTCTFSYSMAFWTWERWQQEIDWMALHGINAPLNLVGLEVVTRNFLEELGVSEADIDNYIAGPGFMAWFAMNNLEGWGSTINAKDVTMTGNPDWWYTRQEQLCRNMMQRMRELGMQPVIPGFSGQVPYALNNYTTITGFNNGDIVNAGSWGGGFTHPGVVNPSTDSYKNLADIYYKHLHDVMGISEFYSIDPFHEMTAPVSPNVLYPGIMAHLDRCYALESDEDRARFNAPALPKWIVQQWQGTPVSGAFSAMSSYGDRFIGLDLFADAPGKAQWNGTYYQGRPYIFCMLHNFGGRSGLHGRLESTMNDYFRALAKNNNCQGIGATPEGSETNPILYDMLFELPWMDVNNHPTADEWLAQYAHARYGVDNTKAPAALEALKNLKKSVWACPTDQQGTSEAVILARPKWEVKSVSTWSKSAIYWDPQDVLQAADGLYSIKDIVTKNGGQDGVANYNYDFIDVVRQAMVDYAAELLPLIKAAHDKGDNTEYTRLYKLYLQLMLDLDTMLSYDAGFKLERWTSLARNIADEVAGTTENDRNWLEWNARTQVTVWAGRQDALNDYSNRCWAGLIKDFHYERWKYFFENNGAAPGGNWYSGFERPWTVNFTDYDYSEITIPNDMTATEKAAETFGKYFGRVMGATKNYIFPMGVTRDATKSDAVAEVNRGQDVELPLKVGKDVTITSVWVDLNNDGAASNAENLDVTDGNKVAIAADAAIGKTTAKVTYDDGTVITFSLALVEEITEDRTVTAEAGANGSVAIEGTNELSISTTEPVKMTATANTGYNFEKWTDAQGNTVSNDNPYIYYGKEDATFTANFIQNKWGVVECAPDVDGAGNVKDEADVMEDVSNNNQYIHNLTLSYYNREDETIFEPTTAPTSIFTTIPQIVNVPQGASFTVEYDKGISNGFQHCYFRAYIDLNADGDFDDEGELLKEVGTKGDKNTAVCSNSINVLLPYTMPLGITHMRLRFDSAWNIGDGAKARSVRPVYDLVINVTEGSDKAAHITVASNNDAWGTVKVWTNETPADITATEWNVTKGVDFNIAAEKTSEDVEFLGWYDQYGRLLTTELAYSMKAREDATYTAKFRKALDIDGWVFEYRTEPGSEIVTNKLAKGVKPEAGKTYYIYAPTRPTNDGEYVNRYLYNNSGTLTLSTAESTAASYLWVCGIEDGKCTFQNVADPTKYLKHKGLANAPYGFELGTGTTYYEGITLQSVPGDGETRNLFFVINDNGSGFNHSEKTHNQSTEDFTTDFVFTKVSAPDVVILTSVRKNGDHDLEIPETVEILGEQCKIVGFDNNLFNNNKDLWTISLPQTIQFLSEKSLLNGTMTGAITPGAGRENSADYTIYTLPDKVVASDGFKITVKGTTNGNCFNQWGSGLFATGTNPLAPAYQGGFQFYLAKDGSFVIKVNNSKDDEKVTISNCKAVADKEFTAIITYKSETVTIQIDNGNGQTATYTKENCTLNDISAFSAAIPTGITLNVNVETDKEADPFEGCSNLLAITFPNGYTNYRVADGKLYNASDYVLHTLTDADKEDEIRVLGALIDNTKALMDVIAASVDATGKATEIALTTTVGEDYYIWCNAPQDDEEGDVGRLLDNTPSTFFHSNWESTTAPTDNLDHHLTIENVKGIGDLKFHYQARTGSGLGDYPKTIKVQGSNNGTDYTDIAIVQPRNANGGTIENGAEWTSEKLGDGNRYTYLRFMVTATTTNKKKDGHIYWHMAEFDLFKLTSTVEVVDEYKELGGITNEEAAEVYDNLVNALYVYNNGGTADELQAAYNALEPLYSAVNEKKSKMEYVRELNELIPATETLIKAIATSIAPVGKATEIALTTTEGQPNYIWCNAPTENEGVANLLDGQDGTILHTEWNAGAVSAYQHYLLVSVEATDLYNFSFRYKARTGNANDMNFGDIPSGIKVYGSNEEKGTYEELYTVSGLSQTSGYDWTSPAIDAKSYRYLRFNVTANSGFWHMAEFDLFKLTSDIEVAPEYKTFGGINNEETEAAYDCMVNAQALCSNGTAAELEAALNALQSKYDALKAKKDKMKVLNGVYKLQARTYMDDSGAHDFAADVFVAYNTDATDHQKSSGYKLIATGTYTASVEADKYFTITPNDNGYTLQAQGLYVKAPQNLSSWAHILCTDDVSIAGYYLLEDVGGNLYKLVNNQSGNNNLNVWESQKNIFGNENSNKFSKIALEKVEAYSLTITPARFATLCLPFNVVMPEGMYAYDLAEECIKDGKNAGEYIATMRTIAMPGETLKKGTPVIVAGEPKNYNLAITMDDTNAKGALEGSLLKGNFISQTLIQGSDTKKYIFANGANGVGFYLMDESGPIGANKCWMEWTGQAEVRSFVISFDDATGISDIIPETKENSTHLIYNISGQRLNKPQKGLNIIGNKKVIIK